MADSIDGWWLLFLLDKLGYFSHQKAKLLLGHAEKLFIRHDIPPFKLSYQLMKHAPLLSPGNPFPHIHFPISFLRPFLVFAVQKAQAESGKRSLPTEKELSSRHLCLHTTDQSYAQDSANLKQYVLLPNKLVTQVVIRATENFNCTATMLQDKLKKNVAHITGPLSINTLWWIGPCPARRQNTSCP